MKRLPDPKSEKNKKVSSSSSFQVLFSKVRDSVVDLAIGYLYQFGIETFEQKKEGHHTVLIAEAPSGISPSLLCKKLLAISLPNSQTPLFLSSIVKKIQDTNWMTEYQKYLKPILLTDSGKRTFLTIDPTGSDFSPDSNTIFLDAGLAFGTGTHPTTQLSAQLLMDAILSRPIRSVLDIGCGTGILAMIAKRKGVQKVLGVENDPDALQMARLHLVKNNLSEVQLGEDLLKTKGKFDLIVANILLSTLIELKPEIERRLHSNGLLILSGITYRDVPVIRKAYSDFDCLDRLNKKGWTALLCESKI